MSVQNLDGLEVVMICSAGECREPRAAGGELWPARGSAREEQCKEEEQNKIGVKWIRANKSQDSSNRETNHESLISSMYFNTAAVFKSSLEAALGSSTAYARESSLRTYE